MEKKLKREIDILYPRVAQKSRVNKRDGTITVDWLPIARVEVVSKEAPAKIRWSFAGCLVHELNTDSIGAKFSEISAASTSGATIEWSG